MRTVCGCPFQGVLFPFIDPTGNSKVIDDTAYFREDEENDERGGRVVALINANQDWTQFTWELEEPAVAARRGKPKINDHGSESRKKNMLCQRVAEHNSGVSSEMKTFMEDLFTSSFTSLKEVLQKDIQEQFHKVNNEIDQLKEQMFHLTGPSNTVGRGTTTKTPCPSGTMGKGKASETPGSGKASETPSSGKASQSMGSGKASHTMVSPVSKEKIKCKQEGSKDPPTVRRSPQPGRNVTRK
ncbi:unnamed protein product [Eruca vesicaria subsp. sativa]|uniref:Uncharacterized protein n=1 Tax=Eruca vesicaria subsp. sativa TaxID=29727 RepID=A0ABC8M228_ERUVS|nr:unnamed protein product [Eruca vesicaria subsp. sativa]